MVKAYMFMGNWLMKNIECAPDVKFLLLDNNYLALSLLPLRRVIKLMANDKVEPVAGSSVLHVVRHSNLNLSIPSVLKLKNAIPWKAHAIRSSFSRRSIALRDDFLCQFCGIKVGKSATIDHVIPRSRGGKTDYSNCVWCCSVCNNKKGNRTPTEAGMKLLRQPKRPTFLALHNCHSNKVPKEWNYYLT